MNDKKFPLAPGAHVICASKHAVTPQPSERDYLVYCAIGMAVPEDPTSAVRRSTISRLLINKARCFMEDAGYSDDVSDPEAFRLHELKRIANSYIYIGQAQR